MNSYFRIRLFNIPSTKEEFVTQHAFSCGASGISEALAYTQPDLTYDPDVIPKRSHDIDVFFPERPGCNFFDGLLELHGNLQWEINEEQNQDWLAEWKKGFVPFQLAGQFWIVPSWCESPTDPVHSIRIDPGMAFGTGTHATTKMASYFVNKLSEVTSGKGDFRLLDVGTGTGVLAMLAKKSGFQHVVGIEIDPEARRVARENIKANNLKIEVPDLLLEEVSETFDLVVANIIDGVLLQIKDSLLRALRPGGQLFVTGILLERENQFIDKFLANTPLTVHRRIEQDEWVGYWLKT